MPAPFRGKRSPDAGGEAGDRPRAQPGERRVSASGSWLQWARAQPALAAAILAFCVIAIGGLVLSLPSGIVPADRGDRVADEGPPANPPAAAPADTAPSSPAPPAPTAPTGEVAARGPWVVQSASAPSPRGLALVYAYRKLPPGGESRYEWFVRLQGSRSLLEGVDLVRWRMDPPPKDGDDLVSRNRAGDGFPLLGDGPGGWFGVSATVRYKDGKQETLSRRIELPD